MKRLTDQEVEQHAVDLAQRGLLGSFGRGCCHADVAKIWMRARELVREGEERGSDD